MYKDLLSARTVSFVACCALIFIFHTAAVAQTRISSPFSRYGLGELQFHQNFANQGMAGLGIGFRSNINVNNLNPASYTAFDTTSFVFEATVFSHFYQQLTATQSQQSNYTSLGSVAFGFPVTRWWGVGLGLKPFSSVGYKIRDFEDHELVGRVNYLYEGQGGINQVFIGNAFQLFRGFSVGVNSSYLWGSLERHATVQSDTTGFFLTNRILSNQINGWHFGFGAQYVAALSEKSNITLGITYGHENPVNARMGETIRRRLPAMTNSPFDTIHHVEGLRQQINIPAYWGAGAFMQFNNNWGAGMDFQWQNWEAFEMFGQAEGLNNSYQAAFGIQHQPSVQTYSTFLNRIRYRAGFRYGQTYLNPFDEPLDEFGISFGLVMPVRRTPTGQGMLNISMEYGQRGTPDLIQENFFRINLGVNVNENWFIRRRFL